MPILLQEPQWPAARSAEAQPVGFTVGGRLKFPSDSRQRPLFLLLRLQGTTGATAIASGRQRIYADRAQR